MATYGDWWDENATFTQADAISSSTMTSFTAVTDQTFDFGYAQFDIEAIQTACAGWTSGEVECDDNGEAAFLDLDDYDGWALITTQYANADSSN